MPIDNLYRDARQIGQVGRFFTGDRPPGLVGFSPLRWTTLLGRPGAMVWLLGSAETARRGDRPVVENVFRALLASPFEREPSRYRVAETGRPGVLPTLSSGYVHATVVLPGGARRFVLRDAHLARIDLTTMVDQIDAKGSPRLLGPTFVRVLSSDRPLALATECIKRLKQSASLPVHEAAARRLAAGTGMSRAAATALFAGKGFVPYERPSSLLDPDYAAEMLDACLGDDPGAPFAPLGDGPRDANSGVARMLACHERLTAGPAAPFRVTGKRGLSAVDALGEIVIARATDRSRARRAAFSLSAPAAAAVVRVAGSRAGDYIDEDPGELDARGAAVALHGLRVAKGIDAFRRAMRDLAKAAGAHAEEAIDFVYGHTELG